MKGLFWWRKDKKLEARIDNVVEITERARKAFRPKPLRVTIDTSFIDRANQPDDDEARDNHDKPADVLGASPAEDAAYVAVRSDHDASDTAQHSNSESYDDDASFEQAVHDVGLGSSETFELLQVALERFEAAEQAEADARKEADELRARAEEQEARAAEAATARDEAVRRADEYELELANLREEAANRDVGESGPTIDGTEDLRAELDAKTARLEDIEQELASLRATVHDQDEALRDETAARERAEAERDRAVERANELEQELGSLRNSEKDLKKGQREEAKAKRRVEAARRTAETQRDKAVKRSQQLEEELAALREADKRDDETQRAEEAARQRVEAAKDEMEAERDEAVKRADSLESELAALRESVDEQKKAHGREAKALEHTEGAKREAEAARDQALQRTVELEKELASLRDAVEAQKKAQQDEADARKTAEANVLNAQAERDRAMKSADRLEQKLEQVTGSADRDRAAREDVAQQLAETEAARLAAEAERDKATLRADELEQELLVLRERPATQDKSAQSEAKPVKARSAAAVPAKAKAPEPKTEDEKLRALRMATDNALVINRGAAKAQQVVEKVIPAESSEKIDRKDKRTSSKVRATFEKEGTGHSRFCMIVDKSSSGAKLEIVRGKLGSAVDDLIAGDRLTLMFTIGQERTSVACEVKWVEGSHCGVMYRGQFRTEIIKQQKKPTEGLGSGKAKKPAKWFARA